MRRITTTLALALLGALSETAHAEAPLVALEKRFAADLAAHADDRIREDIRDAKVLAQSLSDAALADRCTVAIGKVLDGTTHDDLRIDVLKALGEIGRAAGGAFVAPVLAQTDPEAQNVLIPVAIDVAGRIHSDDLVVPLLRLVDKSHVIAYAVAATKALAEYRASTASRVVVVEVLIDSVRRSLPVPHRWSSPHGGGTDPGRTDPGGAWGPLRRTSEAETNRYEALAPVMKDTCNQLTRQNVATPEEWFKLRDEYKTHMGDLFPPAPK